MQFNWVDDGFGSKKPDIIVKGKKCPMCTGRTIASSGISAWRCVENVGVYNQVNFPRADLDYLTHDFTELVNYKPENEFGPVSP